MNNNWSFTPLSKIINAHSQPSRILWIAFSITMVGGLIISVILTVHQYLEYATVFRMDYSESNYFNDLPAVTICHNNHRITNRHGLTENLHTGIRYELPPSNMTSWSTQTAISKIYRNLSNYTAKFKTDLLLDLRLTVVEQLPRPKNQICTIFELSLSKNHAWTSLEISMQQENPLTSDFFEVVIHNKQSFPFNNYERYLYRRIDPGKNMFMFTAKSVTNHLNTFRNPCANTTIDLLNINFAYDQTVCQWQQMCNNLEDYCHCSCELDVIGILNHTCPDRCLQRFSRALVNTTTCPQACHKTKYSDLNVVIMDLPIKEKSVLIIVMSDLVSIATEEPIYTLTKMFSEIGGLSSLLFGLSSILVFELIEKILDSLRVLKTVPKPKNYSQPENYTNQRSCNSESTDLDARNSYSYPVQIKMDDFTYSTFLSYDYTSLYTIGISL